MDRCREASHDEVLAENRRPTSAPLKVALRNRDLRRVILAYFASAIAEWAIWSGILVYAYSRGGAGVAGIVSLGLLVPGAAIAPFAGAAADGPRPIRVLAFAFAAQALTLGLAAAAAYLHGPLVTVIVPAAAGVTLITYVRPCYSVVVPGLVTSAKELTAANLLTGYCDSTGILLGPLIAAGLIALDGPALVIAACAGLALFRVAATAPLLRVERRHHPSTEPVRQGSRMALLVDGVRAMSERPGALQLLVVLGGPFVMFGALDLLYVVLAAEQFGLGASGPGLLAAAFGLGAFVGGVASTILVARERLAPLLLISMLAICAAMFVVAGFPTLSIALLALPVAGVSRAVLDLSGRMLMQRVAPQDALASIFATMESLALIGCAIGSVIAQVMIAVAGVRVAALSIGVVLTLMLLATARRLLEVDSSADAPVVQIRLLRRIPVFAPLPGPALEGLARATREVRRSSGHEIVRQGEVGDSYYAIVQGVVEVTVDGSPQRTMTRGEGFGEIALLADVPRAATVTATTDVELLELERSAFLTAVVGHDVTNNVAWGVARGWHAAHETNEVVAPSIE